EEPHVLDRDDGLIGEGLEQCDLSLGEELRLGPAKVNRANRDAFPHQGNAQVGAGWDGPREPLPLLQEMALAPRQCAADWELVCLGLQVIDVDGPAVEYRAAIDRPPYHRDTELADTPDGDQTMVRDK